LSYAKIEFDDRILALILLASLLNIWEAIRMVVSNSIEKSKLKYDDIRDLILEKKKFKERVQMKTQLLVLSYTSKQEVKDLSEAKIITDCKSKLKSKSKYTPRKQNDCCKYRKFGHLIMN
jgi:GTPase involved in cell partitioning and DNA repair